MENKLYRLTIGIDNDPIDPREWENYTKIYCEHKSYNLPKEIEIDNEYCESWEDVINEIQKKEKDIMLFKPIYMLDHSGISVSLQDYCDKWDSGQIGFIWTTKKLVKEVGLKPTIEEASKLLELEFKSWKRYIEGEIYSYCIEKKIVCPHCNAIEYEVVDTLSRIEADNLNEIREVIEENTSKDVLNQIEDLLENIQDIEIEY